MTRSEVANEVCHARFWPFTDSLFSYADRRRMGASIGGECLARLLSFCGNVSPPHRTSRG
jgi:hypothetical protein